MRAMSASDESSISTRTPFTGLTPDMVLDALEVVGLRGDGRLLQLNSYENRVFQVFLEDGRVVVAKFYRPGRWTDTQILEEHLFAAELAAAEVPVVAPLVLASTPDPAITVRLVGNPPTLAAAGGHRYAISPRRSGRSPSLESIEHLEWIGRFIGRMHSIGARRPFEHRLKLSVATLGRASRNWIIESNLLPPDIRATWTGIVDEALDLADAAFERAAPTRSIRLHGDCHINNLLWTDEGPHFVDLDDAMNGPAVQDLWMMLSGEPNANREQMRALLTGYESFMEFDDRELGLIEALRTLRLVHHSAWLAKRWDDPAFPIAFPWFGGASYWQQQAQVLREQIAAMHASPAT
jgi:Ser/Thr protein kinase RdoA (MazF antagonist)